MVDWVMSIPKSVWGKLRVVVERRRGGLLLVAWAEWSGKEKRRVKTGRGVVKRDPEELPVRVDWRYCLLWVFCFCFFGELGLLEKRERDEITRVVSAFRGATQMVDRIGRCSWYVTDQPTYWTG